MVGKSLSFAWQQAILDSSDFIIISTDTNGVIQTQNAGALNTLGYPSAEIIGKATPSIFHDPKEVEQRAKALSKELGERIKPGFETFVAKARLGTTDDNIWTLIRKDQSRFPAYLSVTALNDDSGQLLGFLGIGKDVTAQQKAEASLLESEARFSAAFQDAPIGMALVSPKGQWLRVNDALAHLLGYAPLELMDLTLSEIIHPEDRTVEAAQRQRLITGVIDKYCLEIRCLHQQRHEVWVLLNTSQIKNQRAVSPCCIVQVQDISQRKAAEAKLQRLNVTLEDLIEERTSQLKSANEVAKIANQAKSRFIANMSAYLRSFGTSRINFGAP